MASDLQALLSKLSGLRIPHEEALAPRFNVFHYFKVREIRATAILEDLLNPKGRHGQGALFLKDFLKNVEFSHPDLTDQKLIRQAIVHPEEKTDENRYLDLTIEVGKCKVGLENKIWAREGHNQLDDYIKHLKHKPGEENWFFILLTPDEEWEVKSCPKEKWAEYETQGRVRLLSYRELSEWICSWADKCKAERIKTFLEDMAVWANGLPGGE